MTHFLPRCRNERHSSILAAMRLALLPAVVVAALVAAPPRRGVSAWTSRDLPLAAASSNAAAAAAAAAAGAAGAAGAATESDATAATDTSSWAKHALLISSFSDGVVESSSAKAYLKLGLAKSLAFERSRKVEDQVRESVLFSPCAGPSIDLLNSLEEMDDAVSSLSSPMDASEMERRANDFLQQLSIASADGDQDDGPINCRILYIPTAMYALNPESKNTPGKQRQRARADGKKRRNLVVKTVQELIGERFACIACTLDLDDGSINQPVGSDDASLFPRDGKESFSSWEPHLIYVEGGNTFWLQHCLEKGDWEDDLRQACVGNDAYAVYVGKSAGAIIAGSRVDTATWKGWDNPAVVPGRETYDDWAGYQGMSLFAKDASIFPHMDGTWQELVEEKTKQMIEEDGDDVTVYSLQEWEACCIDGEAGNVFVVSAGERQQQAVHDER